jgi:hypothetical protein
MMGRRREIPMDQHDRRFDEAVARFDSANAQDPNIELSDGKPQPKELIYSQRMTRWLERLAADASEPLRLAARCQHLRRWEIPRSAYPMDRAGYHRWRTDLARMHAERAGQILREVGYDDSTIARVQSLVRKERLKQDPEVQLLEDVICLVFLESYFADFAKQHDEQKVIGILRRTWKKMSPRGQAEALKLPLGPSERTLVERALADDSGP